MNFCAVVVWVLCCWGWGGLGLRGGGGVGELGGGGGGGGGSLLCAIYSTLAGWGPEVLQIAQNCDPHVWRSGFCVLFTALWAPQDAKVV